MEGAHPEKNSALEVEREFTNSRLEGKILIRAYELVVPVIRRCLDSNSSYEADCLSVDAEVSSRLKKGA